MTDRKDYRTLYQISRAVNSTLEPDGVLQLILDKALEAVGGAIGWISVRDGDVLYLRAVRGIDRGLIKESMSMGEGITGTAARTGQAYYVSDVSQVDNYYNVDKAIRSELAIPLLAFGEVVGVLNVESEELDGFHTDARELLNDFAEEAGVAVKNALRFGEASGARERLTGELAEQVRTLEAVEEISRAVSSSLNLDEVLDIIMQRLAGSVPAEFCQLLLYDDDRDILKIFEPRDASRKIWGYTEVALGEGISGWVAEHRMPLIVPDVSQDHRYVPFFEETKSEMAVPLVKDERLIGVINMESFRPDAFARKHLALVTLLANHAVIAIENARLYDNLKSTQEQVLLNERLATVGEVSSDILHWVANKVGIIPRALQNARSEFPAAAAELETYLEMIGRNARTVLSMKKEMLGKREKLEITACPVLPLVTEVTNGLEIRPPMRLKVDCPDKTAAARADRTQLLKVLQYLAENGLDSMRGRPEGELGIRIRNRDETVLIEVADTGCGIAREHLSQIFNSFFTTKTGEGGTGMGLWFTYRSLKKMDGRIEVNSEIDKGTVFRIYLPKA